MDSSGITLGWGEDEYVESVQILGLLSKLREERNLIPHRPYFFNLGFISTRFPQKLTLLQIFEIYAQMYQFDPGEYFFEISVTGEEVEPCVKYFKVNWRGDCTEDQEEVTERFFVSMHYNPPKYIK